MSGINTNKIGMSAFQKVMDCQDLRRYIRKYLPPHPNALIIEEEYLYAFKENRRADVSIICNSTRIKLIKEGEYEDKCSFSFQPDAPTENYACLKHWAFNGLVGSIRFLNYIQDGLNLEHPTYYEIFNFKNEDGDTDMMFSIRFTPKSDYNQLMRDYYEIYKANSYWFIYE